MEEIDVVAECNYQIAQLTSKMWPSESETEEVFTPEFFQEQEEDMRSAIEEYSDDDELSFNEYMAQIQQKREESEYYSYSDFLNEEKNDTSYIESKTDANVIDCLAQIIGILDNLINYSGLNSEDPKSYIPTVDDLMRGLSFLENVLADEHRKELFGSDHADQELSLHLRIYSLGVIQEIKSYLSETSPTYLLTKQGGEGETLQDLNILEMAILDSQTTEYQLVNHLWQALEQFIRNSGTLQ